MRIHAYIKLKMKQKENPDNLPNIYQGIAESICLLDSFSTWSKRNLKIELSCSKKTINKIYNGMDTSLFAYQGHLLSGLLCRLAFRDFPNT